MFYAARVHGQTQPRADGPFKGDHDQSCAASLKRDAIAELANVARGALRPVREMVDSEINLSVPNVEMLDVILRDRPPLFESASATETPILFLNTKFEISQRRPRLRRRGEDVPSINTLRLLFDRLVNRRSDNRAWPNWNYTGKQELLRQLENGDEYADHSLVAWSTGRGGRPTDAYARHLGRASEKHTPALPMETPAAGRLRSAAGYQIPTILSHAPIPDSSRLRFNVTNELRVDFDAGCVGWRRRRGMIRAKASGTRCDL
jgi:hypothetical protein